MVALSTAFSVSKTPISYPSPGPLKGLSIGGGDFDSWPPKASIDYHYGKGMRAFRLPYSMERAQPIPGGSLNAAYMASMDDTIKYILAKSGTTVLTDPHNYGQFNIGATFPSSSAHGDGGTQVVIGESAQYTAAHFADHLIKIASRYDSGRVLIGTNNEPTHATDNNWPITLNTAITAFRAAGLSHWLTVMTNGVETSTAGPTGASAFGVSNSMTQMLRVTDSLNKTIFEIHQYLDADGSGTSSTCTVGASGTSTIIGRFDPVTKWARQNGKILLLGEFAGAANSQCNTEVTAALTYLNTNKDVWAGWYWWYSVHGQPSYIFQLQPDDLANPVDKAQMALLTPFL